MGLQKKTPFNTYRPINNNYQKTEQKSIKI